MDSHQHGPDLWVLNWLVSPVVFIHQSFLHLRVTGGPCKVNSCDLPGTSDLVSVFQESSTLYDEMSVAEIASQSNLDFYRLRREAKMSAEMKSNLGLQLMRLRWIS